MTTGNQIAAIRALLREFSTSTLTDLHVEIGGLTLFLARAGGAANPMQRAAGASAGVAITPTTSITAPHLGLFTAALAVGDALAIGTVVGSIDVLGRNTDVASDRAGRIAAVHVAAGDLVEFGTPLVDIAG